MGQTTTSPPPFAGWLRGQLDERGWGVRTLAKRMNPDQPEIARRALNRYLKGSLPTEGNRAAIAAGLGIDVAEVPTEQPSSDDDDEESGPAMQAAFHLFVDLLGQIHANAVNPKPAALASDSTRDGLQQKGL